MDQPKTVDRHQWQAWHPVCRYTAKKLTIAWNCLTVCSKANPSAYPSQQGARKAGQIWVETVAIANYST